MMTDEDVIRGGLASQINIVSEYMSATGTYFIDEHKLEAVEKFAIWVVCNYLSIEDYNGE